MAINSRTLSSVQSDVTSLTTNETDFRDGLDDVMIQVNATEVKLSEVSTADLTKLNDITASANEINTLDGITATVQELNQLDGVTITAGVLNVLAGYTGTINELNILDGITASQAEINKLDGYTGTYADLNKIASVTSSAADLNALDGFVDTHSGTLGDLVRCIQLDAAGDGTEGQVLTSSLDDDDNFQFSWTTPSSFTFTLEDEDGTEISIDTDEIKIVGDAGITVDWGTGDGTDATPYILNINNVDKGSSQNIFKNIAVTDQDTIQADTNDDTLNLNAGDGITLTTDATTDTLTITNSISAANNATITISGDVTADSTFTVDQSSNATINLSLDAGVVDTTEIADDAVTGAKILDSTITGSKLANTTVTGSKLAYDRRANVYAADIYSGNLYDYTHYDDDIGIRWFIDNGEEMRLEKDGDLHVDGDVIAYSTTVSDERLKKDIQKVENGLDKVCQLSGYTFKYIDNDRQSAGVIAQEVEKVLPEAVVEKKLPFDGLDQDTEYKVVNYASLHSLMIEAIKELKAEIEDLKSKIK